MLAPLASLLTALSTQALTLVPFVAGFGLFVGGGTLALGNHQRGKEGVVCALLGGAVMLVSFTIGAAIKV
jgi:hypothetical protein